MKDERAPKRTELETRIRALTTEINGQFPRPWMTTATDPSACDIVIVGRNQRNAYPADQVGSHDHFINTLFNRGDEGCRELYDRITPAPSPTRVNIDKLTQTLRRHTEAEILETNVICYSTPMSADLFKEEHVGGRKTGREIFLTIWEIVRPKILIAHGAGTIKDLRRLFSVDLPDAPVSRSSAITCKLGPAVFVSMPSLAPPGYNKWCNWAEEYFEEVSLYAKNFIR